MAETTSHHSQDRWRRLVIAALVGVVLLARLPSFLTSVLDIDESDFAVQTAVWMDGGTPYVDFVEKKSPLIHALYGLAFLVGGTWNMTSVHLLFALLSAATGLCLMAAARRASGDKAGIAALALFAAYSAGYDLNDFLMAGTEIPMNLAAAVAAFFAIGAFKHPRRLAPLFLSGLCTGIALLAKHVAVAFLPAVLAADLWSRKKEASLKAAAGDVLAFTAGFLLPLAITAALLAHAGALHDAIRWAWTENFAYAGSSVPLGLRLERGALRFGLYLLVSLPLWILAAGRIAKAVRDRSASPADVLMAVWILSAFPMCALGWRFFPHYFMQFLPPLIVLAACGWTTWLGPALAARPLRAGALLVGLLAPMIAFPAVETVQALRIPGSVQTERSIAREVSKRTSPDDRIFVWGHSSDVYFFSRRLPASRFVYCSFLSGASEGFEGHNRPRPRNEEVWAMLMEDLARRPPAIIVDMSGTGIRGYGAYPIAALPGLDALVRTHYRADATVDGALLFMKQ